jgi:hypothetical protein
LQGELGAVTITLGSLGLTGSIGELPAVNTVIGLTGDTGINAGSNPPSYFFIQGITDVQPNGYVSLLGAYPYVSGGTWNVGLTLITTQDAVIGFLPGGTINFYTLS